MTAIFENKNIIALYIFLHKKIPYCTKQHVFYYNELVLVDYMNNF